MRIQSALGLSVGVMLSCTAENPAYSGSGEGDMSGTAGPGTATSTTSESTSGSGSNSNSNPTPSSGTHDSGTTPESGTQGTTTGIADTDTEARCWSTSITIAPDARIPLGQTFAQVPVRVATSRLAPKFNGDSLRFYQDGMLLAHEQEGRFAWVRVTEIVSEGSSEIQALMGAACPDDMPPAASNVWSAGYIAVFHFDDGDNVPLTFVDSVNDIELLPDPNTEVGGKGLLGPYIQKSGDGRLEATNAMLDLNGDGPLSTLGWVRLEGDEAGVLEWDGVNARHRELVAKLPGYRLNAVRGHAGPMSTVAPAPFFNLSLEIPGELQDNTFGEDDVQANDWTMLAGTYDGEQMHLFQDGDLVASRDTNYTPGSNGTGTIRIGRWLRGGIDEVRISNVARSPAWLQIQYESMMGTLLEYGPLEQVDP